MMQLVPERIGDVVVFSVAQVCSMKANKCGECGDLPMGLHNWMLAHDVEYAIVDLQDEKEVCEDFLVEVIQLKKRLRKPFYFVGVMERPQKVFDDYDYTVKSPIFGTPEQAISQLERSHSALIKKEQLAAVEFGHPLVLNRSRASIRGEGEVEADAEETEDEE